MLISEKHKFIYLHIPKCAGHTIKSRFEKYNDRKNIYHHWKWNEYYSRFIDMCHIPLNEFHNISASDYKLLQEYFVFTFVRNPYDRFFAAHQQHSFQHNREISVEDLLKEVDSIRIRYDVKYIHLCPMHYLTHIGKKRIVDEIFRQEQFENEFDRLITTLGITDYDKKNQKNIRVENVYDNKLKYKDKLTPYIVKRINELYEKDFELFEYLMLDPKEIETNETDSHETESEKLDYNIKPTFLGWSWSGVSSKSMTFTKLYSQNQELQNKIEEITNEINNLKENHQKKNVINENNK